MTGVPWVPSACTLPTVDRPLREAEFDALFVHDVIGVEDAPEGVRLELRAETDVVARAAELAVRETSCCSFFRFELSIAHGNTTMLVSAVPDHADVLDALADRARSLVG
ncbi:hypothetical protein [Aeromicrobium sp. 9AM]|uniref:hypothetical protein n=1 Tax=Aeromicrobium sp. 9AM TaxID=2653126 RepID=UPI0012F38FFF|nr:hypothetical protein [Aeromicrobium sp. 9AM]VXB56545.1 Arsenate reductase [Aeromicrobium sp. 9AM]